MLEIRAASVSSRNCLGGGDDTDCQMVQCGTTYVTQNGGKDMPVLQSSLVLHHLIEFSLWYTRIIVFLSDILMAHVAYNYVVIICLSAPSRDAELYCRCHLHFGLIPITSRQSNLSNIQWDAQNTLVLFSPLKLDIRGLLIIMPDQNGCQFMLL